MSGYNIQCPLSGAGGHVSQNEAVMSKIQILHPKNNSSSTAPVYIIKSPAGNMVAIDWKEADISPSLKSKLQPLVLDGKIDLLIGQSNPELLIHSDYIPLQNTNAYAVCTKLGWAIMGETPTSSTLPNQAFFTNTEDFKCNILEHKKCNVHYDQVMNSNNERIHPCRKICSFLTIPNDQHRSYNVDAYTQTNVQFMDGDDMCPIIVTQIDNNDDDSGRISIEGAPECKIDSTTNDNSDENTPYVNVDDDDISIENISNVEFSFFIHSNDEMKILKALEKCISSQWEVQNDGNEKTFSKADTQALKIMQSTRKKVGDRSQIGCLWKHGCPTLKSNLHYAKKRLQSLNASRKYPPDVKQKYRQIFKDWEERNYLERLPLSALNDKECNYLAHFPIVRNDKSSTKIRIVFDGRAMCDGKSLNSQMYSGPNLLSKLTQVLLRFRKNPYVLCMDAREMYMRLMMPPEDRKYHRILIDDEKGNYVVYQAVSHLFGSPSSGGVANFEVKKTADELKESMPTGAESITNSMICDDLLDSYDTRAKTIKAYKEATKILDNCGMQAHKIMSNCEELMKIVPEEDKAKVETFSFPNTDESHFIKILGLKYLLSEDAFFFTCPSMKREIKCRRDIAQAYPQLYDPGGKLIPLFIKPKTIMQESFIRKDGWDTPVCDKIAKDWAEWYDDMQSLYKLRVKRCTREFSETKIKDESMHVFADASETAVCAVAYRVSTTIDENVNVSFLMAKMKITPSKVLSIPRLELVAAEKAVDLYLELKPVHSDIPSSKVYFYTDSRDVLGWLFSETKKLSRFIAHRISKIDRETMSTNWSYVSTNDNPADVGTKERTVSELINCDLWFQGPGFLKSRSPKSLSNTDPLDLSIESEGGLNIPGYGCFVISRKAKQILPLYETLNLDNFATFSRYIRVIGSLKKFIHKWKARTKISRIWKTEKENTITTCIRMIQTQFMFQEKSCIYAGRYVHPSSKFAKLDLFSDESEILRVGGRTKKISFLKNSIKHPIVIPAGKPRDIILRHIHYKTQKHVLGRSALTSGFSEKYFSFGVSVAVERICKFCFICKREYGLKKHPKMSEIPEDAMPKSPEPFHSVQLDMFGHFFILQKKQTIKLWILAFVCIRTKSIHLEILDSTGTQAITMAIDRMSARRGMPRIIYLDNQPAFRAAEKWLSPDVTFHFAAPRYPNSQGLVENAGKMIKKALNVLGNNGKLSRAEFETLTIVAEGILNSRPIASVPNGDLKWYISPSDFLGDRGLRRSTNVHANETSLSRRWIKMNDLIHEMWLCYSKQHLKPLFRRQKWPRQGYQFEVGDPVVFREYRNESGKWPVGRVSQVLSQDKDQRRLKITPIDQQGNILKDITRHACDVVPLKEK